MATLKESLHWLMNTSLFLTQDGRMNKNNSVLGGQRKGKGMLILSRRIGETLVIADNIHITLLNVQQNNIIVGISKMKFHIISFDKTEHSDSC